VNSVKVKLTAIHDTDLEKALIKLEVYENVLQGKYRCYVCGKVITIDTLGAFFKTRDGTLHFVCNDVKCLTTIIEVMKKLSHEQT